MKNKTKMIYTALVASMVWFALLLQFILSIPQNMAAGMSFVNAFIFIVSYYTIQTNLLIAIAMTSLLKPDSLWGRFFSQTSVLTAIAVYIIIVGLIYNIVLKGIVRLDGMFILADFLLHTASPIAFVVYWLKFTRRNPIQWAKLIRWSYFPLLYLAYILGRGALTNRYPYFFVNATQYGYAKVFVNSFCILLLFMVLGALLISLNNFLYKKQVAYAGSLA